VTRQVSLKAILFTVLLLMIVSGLVEDQVAGVLRVANGVLVVIAFILAARSDR
jgi:hypothetical protein